MTSAVATKAPRRKATTRARSRAIVPRHDPADVEASRKRLDEAAEQYRTASRASNTRRTYGTGLRSWEAYAKRHGELLFPAEPEAISRYLAWLATRGRSVSTIEVYLAALAAVHEHAGLSATPTRSYIVTETMEGIRRELGTRPTKKDPLTWERLLQVLPPQSARDLASVRLRALLLLGFALGARRSELAGLRVSDVEFERQGMLVRIRRSKTDQRGRGRTIGIARQNDTARCPVRAVRRWLRAAGIERGAIFREINRHGTLGSSALDGRSIARIVKACAEAADLDGDFAGHSLRRGFITAAYDAGVPEIAIQRRTGHRSVQVLREYADEARAYEDEPLTEIAASARKKRK